MKKKDERKLQQECWLWFQETYGKPSNEPQLLMHSVVNGFSVTIPSIIPIQYHEKIRFMIANAVDILLMCGMVKGVSDCLVHGVVGRCIWVEFKTEIGKQRDAQIRQQKRTEKNGGIYIVPRSLEQFQTEIKKHLVYLMNP